MVLFRNVDQYDQQYDHFDLELCCEVCKAVRDCVGYALQTAWNVTADVVSSRNEWA